MLNPGSCSTRVMLVYRLAEMRTHDMRVDLRGSDISMAQHGLHAAQVGTALQQMRRECVPEDVRAHVPEYAR
jgi:hypothetical protein